MDPSDNGSPDLCACEQASVDVLSVWALRLCQQVQGWFFFSAICFLSTESIFWHTGNDVKSVYSLNNSSPKPLCLPVACHSFLFPFLHTLAYTSVREAVVAVRFLPFPTSLRILQLMPANISNPPTSSKLLCFAVYHHVICSAVDLLPWVFTCQRSCLLQRKYRTCPIFYPPKQPQWALGMINWETLLRSFTDVQDRWCEAQRRTAKR